MFVREQGLGPCTTASLVTRGQGVIISFPAPVLTINNGILIGVSFSHQQFGKPCIASPPAVGDTTLHLRYGGLLVLGLKPPCTTSRRKIHFFLPGERSVIAVGRSGRALGAERKVVEFSVLFLRYYRCHTFASRAGRSSQRVYSPYY